MTEGICRDIANLKVNPVVDLKCTQRQVDHRSNSHKHLRLFGNIISSRFALVSQEWWPWPRWGSNPQHTSPIL